MAAGAGALRVRIGGDASYHGRIEARPPLGQGAAPTAADIERALALVARGAWLWGSLALTAGLLMLAVRHA
jgi:adenosylcobinamide-phosphate synthase